MAGSGDDIPHRPPGVKQKLGCYSRLHDHRAEVVAPRNVKELETAFADARRANRRVTLRAGAHSFDRQAIGDDLVISMMKMNRIEVDPEKRTVTVEAGAKWGAILAELKPHGLVPSVTVTTEDATAGGTMSGDCLSRFSPSYGKEGEHIKSFELVTVDGNRMTCTPPERGTPRTTWSLEERAFCAVISGLGYLGAVTKITYAVQSPVEPGQEIKVETHARKKASFAELAEDLVPEVREAVAQTPDPRDPWKRDALWSALDSRKKKKCALLFTSFFCPEGKCPDAGAKPMLLHRPKLAIRLVVEWAMRVPLLARALWWGYVTLLFRQEEQRYVDELEGFTFFMDGNARAKRLGELFRFKMKNAQQTFVVPRYPMVDESWKLAERDLTTWLECAHAHLRKEGLTPTLHDVLYLPSDRPFALSASADMPGFAVSYAFETSSRRKLNKIEKAFTELADKLWDDHMGRVYLVKNVFAKPETLRRMYADGIAEFWSVKDRLDPDGRLVNEFLKANLPRPPSDA